MKQTAYILILFFSSHLCRAQKQSMMFEKTWGPDSPMFSNAILYVDQQPNGDYFMIGGKTIDFWGQYQHYACRTDSVGTMLWEMTWGVVDARCGFSKIIKCANGTYMAVGSAISPFGGGIADFTVTNIESNGNIIFTRYYDFGYEDGGYDIIPTYDGGYVISGVKGTSPSAWHPAFLKIDSSGNEIWRRTQSSLANYSPFAISQTRDSGFVLIGQTYYQNYYNCYYAKFDSDGMMEWIKYPFGLNDSVDNNPGTIRANHDGTFDVIYDVNYASQPAPVTAILFRYNNQGDTIWRKDYHEPLGLFFVRPEDTTLCCMMAGAYAEMNSSYDFEPKTDQVGDNHWIYGFYRTNDGGYVGGGYTSGANAARQFYVIKYSPEGRYQATPFLSQITIGPNPSFDGNILVNFDVQTDENVQVRILGMDGRLVYYDEIFCPAGSHTELPIDVLGASTAGGVYILEVKTSAEFRREKLIIGRPKTD